MKKVLILKGLPASGKSTYAKALINEQKGVYKRISKDDLRSMLDDGQWSGPNEKLVLKIRDLLILSVLDDGGIPIVDDTNVNPVHQQHIRNLCSMYKEPLEVEVKMFDCDVEECIVRDLKRPVSVGERVIRKMYNDYVRPMLIRFMTDAHLPSAVICDLDGTLALHNGRSPYDTTKCETNLLNENISWIVKREWNESKDVLLVSGREESFRPETERWLKVNNIKYTALFMRPQGDKRKDNIVKQEIYEQSIKGKYNVLYVLDDRLRVCRMWYEQGLTVLRVGDPDASF